MTVDRGEVHAVLFDLDHTLWERDTACTAACYRPTRRVCGIGGGALR